MSRDQEKNLVARCQQGDRQALDALIRQYERPIYNAAFRMLGDSDEAADVTQTTFLKAFENIDSFDVNRSFFSWIYRIALNAAIDQLKRGERLEPWVESPADGADRPYDRAARAETADRLQAALMDIGDDSRTVLVLRYFSECSYHQIGEILGVPDKTVKSRLYSARQQLKARLERDGKEVA